MAICNLFNKLSKDTGNFLLFDQFSNDLTKCFVQHDSYDIMPSKFVVLDVNYNDLETKFFSATANTAKADLNKFIPWYFQGFYENGCAWMRSESSNNSTWTHTNWTPEYSKHIFWNALKELKMIHIEDYKTSSNWSTPLSTAPESFNTIRELRYIGNIDVHSFEEKDGVGYNEFYCQIPNDAKRYVYPVDSSSFSSNSKSMSYWPTSTEYSNYGCYMYGYNATTAGIVSTNSNDVVSPGFSVGVASWNDIKYKYSRTFEFEAYRRNNIGDDETDLLSTTSKLVYKDIRSKYVNTDYENKFKFNTIVILYDVYVKNTAGQVTTTYSDIPMGIYFTGKAVYDNTTHNVEMTNEVTKYEMCKDAYNTGTSYGLRICTRYLVTPNSTTIQNVTVDPSAQYAGFSQAMNKMADSQAKMDEVLSKLVTDAQDIKEHLATFKNNKTNVPYIRKINNIPYWFVNGKNTGTRADGASGTSASGAHVTQNTVSIKQTGTGSAAAYNWYINGVDTRVRAEGKDGIGVPGADGHSPEVAIDNSNNWTIDGVSTGKSAVPSISSSNNNYTWVVNGVDTRISAVPTVGSNGNWVLGSIDAGGGVDTGVKAAGTDGVTPSITTNSSGQKVWKIGDTVTSVVAEGKDGATPEITTNAYNQKVWKIGDTVTSVVAEGKDGKSVYVTSSDINSGTLTTTAKYNIGDTILKTDNSGGMTLYTVTNSTTSGANTTYNLSSTATAGGIGNIEMVNSSTSSAVAPGQTGIALTNKQGVKTIFTAKSINSSDLTVVNSTKQKQFHHLNEVVYCCGKPKHVRETYLEIPCGRYFKKTGTNSYDVYVVVPKKYRGLRGDIIIRPLKGFHSPNPDDESNPYAYTNGNYFRFSTGGGYFVQSGDDYMSTLIMAFNNNDNILSKKHLIYSGVTANELKAINNSYKISGHIGRVHVYVDMSELYGQPKMDDGENNPLFGVTGCGIMTYDKSSDMWKVRKVSHPVHVLKHNKIVQGFSHTPAEPKVTPATNFETFMRTYNPNYMYVYTKSGISQMVGGLTDDDYDENTGRLTRASQLLKNKHYFTFSWVPNAYRTKGHIWSDNTEYTDDEMARKWLRRWIKYSPFPRQDMSTLTEPDAYSANGWIINSYADFYRLIKRGGFEVSNSWGSDSNAPDNNGSYVLVAARTSPNSGFDIYKLVLRDYKNKNYDSSKPLNTDCSGYSTGQGMSILRSDDIDAELNGGTVSANSSVLNIAVKWRRNSNQWDGVIHPSRNFKTYKNITCQFLYHVDCLKSMD